MHRGTVFIITNNEKNEFEVCKSIEFNGGMGLDCKGRDMYEMLKELSNKKDFDKMIRNFDNKHFGYKDNVITYLADSQENPYIDNVGDSYFEYSITDNQFKFFYDDNKDYIYTSDSNYIKNMSNKEVQIVCENGTYILKPNQIMIADYSRCINNIGKTFDKKVDEKLCVEKLDIGEYKELSKEKQLLKDIIDFFEELEFNVNILEENGICTGFELETWTGRGVNMIEYIDLEGDYLGTYNVNVIKDRLKAIYENFDIDEQIDMYRQNADYKKVFTIKQSLEDFEEYENRLEDLMIQFADKFKDKNYQKKLENEIEM